MTRPSKAWQNWNSMMDRGKTILSTLSASRFRQARLTSNATQKTQLCESATYYAELCGLHKMSYQFVDALYHNHVIDDLHLLHGQTALDDPDFVQQEPFINYKDTFVFEEVVQNTLHALQDHYNDPLDKTDGHAQDAFAGVVTTRKVINDMYKGGGEPRMMPVFEHLAAYNTALQVSYHMKQTHNPDQDKTLLKQLNPVQKFFEDNDIMVVRDRLPIGMDSHAQSILFFAANTYATKSLTRPFAEHRLN